MVTQEAGTQPDGNGVVMVSDCVLGDHLMVMLLMTQTLDGRDHTAGEADEQ